MADARPQAEQEVLSIPQSDCPPPSQVSNVISRGAFFPAAQNFTVLGGTFTSVAGNYINAPEEPSDLRRIPLGDIYLHTEVHASGYASVRRRKCPTRRLFSARVWGGNHKSRMTVALYEGLGAEEVCHHPYIIQIHGVASSNNIHAAIFYDNLIPFQQFLELYSESPILTVYINQSCNAEFRAASAYFFSLFDRHLSQLECTFWMRRKTGQLCADIAVRGNIMHFYWSATPSSSPNHQARRIPNSKSITSLFHSPANIAEQEEAVIKSLSLAQYHKICDWDLARPRYLFVPVSPAVPVRLGTVIRWCHSATPDEDTSDNFEEVAYLTPNSDSNTEEVPFNLAAEEADLEWMVSNNAPWEVLDTGWIRLRANDILDSTIWLNAGWPTFRPHCQYWLSQANYIFDQLGVTENLDEYVVVDDLEFSVSIQCTTSPDECPIGYLFLCPASDLKIGPTSFTWPQNPAYWSLDPTGAAHNRLSTVDAEQLGFPPIRLTTEVSTNSWDDAVYAGVRKFHYGKGFVGREVAEEMGYPMYELISTVETSPEGAVPEHSNLDDGVSPEPQAENGDSGLVDGELAPTSAMLSFIMHLQLTLISMLLVMQLIDYMSRSIADMLDS
ncbi:hypothetical protein R3P38DRAFT_3037550 [Favolaschia claudopus]|uniref:Uncharacterized protein n=1 Tax=Favolaschia claudopus TaxID=2862362 RepID=A0AAW0AC61_9AGAR